ncbi:hypothetical protein N9L02_00830 [Gammaproteobacteria bacterium]|nr:hypothetical protein [Gammaproteobacteria bacterium]
MRKYIVHFILFGLIFTSCTVMASNIYFNQPKANTIQNKNIIPKRNKVMTPKYFEKSVSNISEARANQTKNLADQKLKNNPEYKKKSFKRADINNNQKSKMQKNPTPIKKSLVKPKTIEKETIRTPEYTGFFGGETTTESNAPQKSSEPQPQSGFGNIYQ